MALILTVIMLVSEHGLFGSCASDDEYSAFLQAQIKNHLVDDEVTNSSGQMAQGSAPIPYSAMTASQISTGWGGSASKALTANPSNRWAGTCTHTNKHAQSWWKVSLDAAWDVKSVKLTNRRDCCGDRLQHVDIYVGGTKCASDVSVGGGQTSTISCVGTGSEIKVQHRGTNYMTMCGFQAFGEQASTGVAKVKLGYCGGNRVGLGADRTHGTNAGSLDACAKFALSDDRCHAGGYFDAVGGGNNYQCKCPTGSCQVNNPPKSGGWTIYKAEAKASTKVGVACEKSKCRAGDWFSTCPAGKTCDKGGCYDCPTGHHRCRRDSGFYFKTCANDKQCHSTGCVSGPLQAEYLAQQDMCCEEAPDPSAPAPRPAPRPTAAPAPRPRPTPAPAPVSAASPGWTYYKVTCSTQPGIETVQASTMDACQEACQKNLECKGFKWFGYKHPDEGHCFLGDDRKDWAGRRTIADKVAGQQAVTQAEAKDERTACAVYDRDAAAAGSGGVAGSGGEDLGGVYIAATAGSDCPSGSEQMDELDCSLASGDLGKKYLGSMCLSSTSGPSYNKRGCLMNGGAGNIMFHSCASTRPVMTKNRALCKKPATIGPFAPSPAVLPSIDTAMQNRYFYLQDKDTITPLERNAKSKCVLISGSHPKLGDAKANCYPLASNIKMLKVTAVYEGNTWFYLRTIDYDYCLELKSGGTYGTHAEITKRCGKSEMGGYQYSHFKLRSFSDDFGRQGTPGVNEIGGPFMLESKVLPNHCLKQRGNDLALGSCNKGFYFWTAPVKR